MAPRVSVVVVVHDMARELPRTLRTLTTPYQRGITPAEVEVIVVDNGSRVPVDEEELADLDPVPVLVRIDDAPPSPAHAANRGIERASADLVGLVVDGARMATPGLLANACRGSALFAEPVVTTVGYHLGHVRHMEAASDGYDQRVEDDLLQSVPWEEDGYQLFTIATLAGSSAWGWFEPLAESSALFLKKELWRRLGGLDERFALPGGGLVNHDLYRRACTTRGTKLVLLLGEGTFHQFHGGAATSGRYRFEEMQADYERLVGERYRAPRKETFYLGRVPEPAFRHLEESVRLAAERRERRSPA